MSERTMTTNTAASVERIEELEAEKKQIIEQYEALLEQHMRDEKQLRTKRYKIETVLVNWLGKYDQEIGELQKDLEIVSNDYLSEKEKMDELEAKFDKQEEQYIILMQEKALEEQRIFDMKLVQFIRLHSCKKIQRWWRDILARRSRRKAKKGKGKKKKK